MAGLVAGFYRGVSDSVIGGVSNVLFAFPPLLLALTLASVLSRSWFTVAVAIAVVYVPIFVRVIRGPVLSLREIDFVRAATSTGQSRHGVMMRHVLPNITPIVIVQVTLSLSWAVLTEAALSFLGLGAPPPAPSLGSMIFDARSLVNLAPWTMIFPGVVVVLVVVSLNLLGRRTARRARPAEPGALDDGRFGRRRSTTSAPSRRPPLRPDRRDVDRRGGGGHERQRRHRARRRAGGPAVDRGRHRRHRRPDGLRRAADLRGRGHRRDASACSTRRSARRRSAPTPATSWRSSPAGRRRSSRRWRAPRTTSTAGAAPSTTPPSRPAMRWWASPRAGARRS